MWFALAIFIGFFFASQALMRNPKAPPPPRDLAAFDWEEEIRRAERRDAELFAQCPTAFWNDPHRYGGQRLHEIPAETLMWDGVQRVPLAYGKNRTHGLIIGESRNGV